jgi:hypothetical protein
MTASNVETWYDIMLLHLMKWDRPTPKEFKTRFRQSNPKETVSTDKEDASDDSPTIEKKKVWRKTCIYV